MPAVPPLLVCLGRGRLKLLPLLLDCAEKTEKKNSKYFFLIIHIFYSFYFWKRLFRFHSNFWELKMLLPIVAVYWTIKYYVMKDRVPEIRHSGAHKQSLKIRFKKLFRTRISFTIQRSIFQKCRNSMIKNFPWYIQNSKIGFWGTQSVIKKEQHIIHKNIFWLLGGKKVFQGLKF